MCGRTCLTLAPNDIRCACTYKNKTNGSVSLSPSDYKQPEWREEFNLGKKYQPSFNIAPTDVTPVLISKAHFIENESEKKGSATDHKSNSADCDRILIPMMWGMIPFWHKGDYRKHGLSTNNCRLEHMLDSKLYKRPFQKGQRCVVLSEGFYEWQTTKSTKPSERNVYFIHMPQINDNIKIENKLSWNEQYNYINLLKMAGLYDVWIDENGDQIYSYSIITFESNEKLSWLHHRSPAILETEQQIADWLDFKRVSDKVALDTLQSAKLIKWHQVSNLVNNSRNKSEQCNKPICNIKDTKIKPKSKIMESWLIIRKHKEDQIKKEYQSSDASSADEDDDNDYVKSLPTPLHFYSHCRSPP